MGVSVYPVLSQEVPGFDATKMLGKALAAIIFDEEGIAEGDKRFTPLMHFYSMNGDGLRDFVASQTGQDPGEIAVPSEEWFAPEDGLQALRPLLEQVRAGTRSVLNASAGREAAEFTRALADDLTSLEAALILAQDHQARFHPALDI